MRTLTQYKPKRPLGVVRWVDPVLRVQKRWYAKFHGDYANLLFLGGYVGHCVTDDLVTDRDSRHGDVIWTNPNLYWGYPPPGWR